MSLTLMLSSDRSAPKNSEARFRNPSEALSQASVTFPALFAQSDSPRPVQSGWRHGVTEERTPAPRGLELVQAFLRQLRGDVGSVVANRSPMGISGSSFPPTSE